MLRLLAKRNIDIGSHRSRVVCSHCTPCWRSSLGAESPRKSTLLTSIGSSRRDDPASPVAQVRYDLAVELLDDIRRLDAQLKASHKRIRDAVRASATSLTDLFGVGPVIAAIAHRLHRRRRPDSATAISYAAYNGTAPVEFSSAGRVVHRLSRRGNRRLNHAIHMVAICQLRQPHSEGRAYFDRRVAEGKTKKEALRVLKRHVSNAVYRQLVADARRARS